MAEDFDPEAMVARFRERAAAVRKRGLPPIEGAERQRFVEQMELDYMDFAILGDAAGELVDGILNLRVDLRPESERPASGRPESGRPESGHRGDEGSGTEPD